MCLQPQNTIRHGNSETYRPKVAVFSLITRKNNFSVFSSNTLNWVVVGIHVDLVRLEFESLNMRPCALIR